MPSPTLRCSSYWKGSLLVAIDYGRQLYYLTYCFRPFPRVLVRKWMYVFTNFSAWAGCDTRSVFKRSLTGLNSEFFFSLTDCQTKAKELSLCHYLLIAGGRIVGFISFLRVLVVCEIQSASSRIWTCVAMSISYDDNHGTKVNVAVQLEFELTYSPVR